MCYYPFVYILKEYNQPSLINIMKLTRIGYNQTVVNLNNGTEIFFSYDTPVAGKSADGIYFRTEEYYSRTTSRHINKYLENVNVVKVSQDVLHPSRY